MRAVVLLPHLHVREHGLRAKHMPDAEQEEDAEDGQKPTALPAQEHPFCFAKNEQIQEATPKSEAEPKKPNQANRR